MTDESVSRTSTTGKPPTLTPATDTRPRLAKAPAKPYADFPLFPHATRRWAKKIKGKMKYFGPWEDAQGALTKYLAQRDYLKAGKRPPTNLDGMTVRRLCDHFHAAKKARRDCGRITPRTFSEYYNTCELLAQTFGDVLVDELTPADFDKLHAKLAERLGKVRLGNEIVRVRSVFKYALANRHIKTPVCYGTEFAVPSAKEMRIERAKKGPKVIEAADIKKLISIADTQMKAMILLAINCGIGNGDIADMRFDHIDIKAGILNFPRPKSGIDRRAILWPVTVKAIKQAIAKRPKVKDKAAADHVFITRYGNAWKDDTTDNPITKEFSKLLISEGIKRKGASFYAIRHTFRTAVDSLPDQRAIDKVMGHVSQHISGSYVEFIDDARLVAVADHVHRWLFKKAMPKRKAKA